MRNIRSVLGFPVSRQAITKSSATGKISAPLRPGVWNVNGFIEIASKYGFIRKPQRPLCITIYTSKGGVLKSTLAFNLARISAIHGIRTCCVGVDQQSDLTDLCGLRVDDKQVESIEELESMPSSMTLTDLYNRRATLAELVKPTDLPTLYCIPEDHDLTQLDSQISARNTGRVSWLRDNVINPLRNDFDIIVVDCPPSWGALISNALFAADVHLIPIECKPGQYRNLMPFIDLLSDFWNDVGVSPKRMCIPTRLTVSHKLSMAICSRYHQMLPDVTVEAIRESVHMERANIEHLSIIESMPRSDSANRMRILVGEIYETLYAIDAEAAVA